MICNLRLWMLGVTWPKIQESAELHQYSLQIIKQRWMAIKLTLLSQGQQALVYKLETGTNALNKTRKALHKRRREAAQIKIKTSTNAPTSTVLNFATSGKCTPSAKQELRSPVEANAPLSQEPLQFRNSAKDSDNNKSKVSDQINVLYDSRSIAGIKKTQNGLQFKDSMYKIHSIPFSYGVLSIHSE